MPEDWGFSAERRDLCRDRQPRVESGFGAEPVKGVQSRENGGLASGKDSKKCLGLALKHALNKMPVENTT